MRFYELIEKKKRGIPLEESEIKDAVRLYTKGDIPDYQMAAFLMAVCFRGMNDEETLALTEAIRDSGDVIDLSYLGCSTVDKHSTGGVGDKTTLIVSPIVAAAGGVIAKMSGRGLGHTGGTVDKLEAIPGYKTSLTPEEFKSQVEKHKIAVIGQSGDLAPADKKIYALRDITATVDSIPLIASSIMGKKLASGAEAIVLDVKYGGGAFMKSAAEAEALAEAMIKIGKGADRKIAAVISPMNEPLGIAVGNLCEVKEAAELLSGRGDSSLRELCLELSAEMLSLSLNMDKSEARTLAEETLVSGKAYEKFKEWIIAQGAPRQTAEGLAQLPLAPLEATVISSSDGYLFSCDALRIGNTAMKLGAGRLKKEDNIDFGAGIILRKKVGERVMRGEILATLYSSDAKLLEEAKVFVEGAFLVSEQMPERESAIYKILR